jgi:hypothetical protein
MPDALEMSVCRRYDTELAAEHTFRLRSPAFDSW